MKPHRMVQGVSQKEGRKKQSGKRHCHPEGGPDPLKGDSEILRPAPHRVQNSKGNIQEQARGSQGYDIIPFDPRDAPEAIQGLADADDGDEDKADLQDHPG